MLRQRALTNISYWFQKILQQSKCARKKYTPDYLKTASSIVVVLIKARTQGPSWTLGLHKPWASRHITEIPYIRYRISEGMATADLHLPILLQHQLHVEFTTLWVAVDYALVRVPSRIVIAITWQAEGSRNSPISCFPTLCSINFFLLIQ